MHKGCINSIHFCYVIISALQPKHSFACNFNNLSFRKKFFRHRRDCTHIFYLQLMHMRHNILSANLLTHFLQIHMYTSPSYTHFTFSSIKDTPVQVLNICPQLSRAVKLFLQTSINSVFSSSVHLSDLTVFILYIISKKSSSEH